MATRPLDATTRPNTAMNHGEAAGAPPDEGESDSAGAAVVRGHRPAPSAAPHPYRRDGLAPGRNDPEDHPRFGGAFSGCTPRPQVFLNATSTDLARRPPASSPCRPAHDRVRCSAGAARSRAACAPLGIWSGAGRPDMVRSAMGRQWARSRTVRSERLTMPANHALLHIGGCSAAVAAPAAATAVAEP